MEEAEDKFEIANVARFISVSSASLGHCLRVLPTPTDFEIVKSMISLKKSFRTIILAQDGRKGSVSYEDPRAEKYLRAIVDELDNLRLIRKVLSVFACLL